MKKIHIITKYFYPVSGGIENSILETYSRFDGKLYDIYIHTSKDNYTEKSIYGDFKKIKNLKVIRYSTGLFGFTPRIDMKDCDILILHNFNIFPHIKLLFTSLMKKIIGEKEYALIISPHGGMTPNYSNLGIVERILKRIINKIMIILANKTADIIRVVSEWEGVKIRELGVRKTLIRFIPDGIEPEAFIKLSENSISSNIKKIVKTFSPYVLQIGKIYPTKKYELAINAIKSLNTSVNLIIVGEVKDKKYFTFLKDLDSKFKSKNKVFFIDRVNIIEKYYLLKNSKVFILSSYWESFGRVVIEALSQALPVIVSDNTAPSILVKGKSIEGFTFREGMQKDFNHALDKSLKLKKSQINKEFSKKYSWDSISKEISELFQNI